MGRRFGLHSHGAVLDRLAQCILSGPSKARTYIAMAALQNRLSDSMAIQGAARPLAAHITFVFMFFWQGVRGGQCGSSFVVCESRTTLTHSTRV